MKDIKEVIGSILEFQVNLQDYGNQLNDHGNTEGLYYINQVCELYLKSFGELIKETP